MEHDEFKLALDSDKMDGFLPYRPIESKPSLPEFPVDALPSWLGAWAAEAASALQVPVDASASIGLSAWALACQRVATLKDVRPGWDIPLNLYALLFMRSGSNKSGVFRAATGPVREYEAEVRKRDRARVDRARAQAEVLQQDRKRLISEAAKADWLERQDIEQRVEHIDAQLAELEEHREYRLIASDATPEAMAALLAEHERIGWFSSEPDILDLLTGRYGNQPNFTVALKAHTGEPFTVDRRGAEPLRCESPRLTICVTLQPSVIERLKNDAEQLVESGLLPRFLPVIPQDTVGYRTFDAPGFSEGVEARYRERIRRMLSTPLESITLRLDAEARERFRQLHDHDLEPRIRIGGDLAFMSAWASKQHEQTLRLAGLIALGDQQEHTSECTVTLSCIERAARLRDYFIAHATYFYRMLLGERRVQPALAVWKYVMKHVKPIKDPADVRFTTRDLHREIPKGWGFTAEQLKENLWKLSDHGYIRVLASSGGPGRPSESWLVSRTALFHEDPI